MYGIKADETRRSYVNKLELFFDFHGIEGVDIKEKSENFLQFTNKIKDSVETTSNPFDNESTFLSTDSRATQKKKGKKRKGRFSHFQEHEDPDIQREIDTHGTENIRIIQ